jgi:hypothetical protein
LKVAHFNVPFAHVVQVYQDEGNHHKEEQNKGYGIGDHCFSSLRIQIMPHNQRHVEIGNAGKISPRDTDAVGKGAGAGAPYTPGLKEEKYCKQNHANHSMI